LWRTWSSIVSERSAVLTDEEHDDRGLERHSEGEHGNVSDT
jgi:hypothetical protein